MHHNPDVAITMITNGFYLEIDIYVARELIVTPILGWNEHQFLLFMP